MDSKIYSSSVYELVIKDIEKDGIVRHTTMFNTYADAKKFAKKYKEDHPKSTIQRIKEVKVYEYSDKG